MVIAFIDDHRDRFGVEPICRVLTEHGCKIAPSIYYAAKNRPPSKRSVRDDVVLAHIVRVHESPTIGRRLHGARKVFKVLAREEARGEHPELGHVPCCQVERLMRANAQRGVRHGRPFITIRSDPGAERPPDLVKRNFTASRPNELWVVDLTYVPTWAGMVFSAFVTDDLAAVAHALNTRPRKTLGWRTPAEAFNDHLLSAPQGGVASTG